MQTHDTCHNGLDIAKLQTRVGPHITLLEESAEHGFGGQPAFSGFRKAKMPSGQQGVNGSSDWLKRQSPVRCSRLSRKGLCGGKLPGKELKGSK